MKYLVFIFAFTIINNCSCQNPNDAETNGNNSNSGVDKDLKKMVSKANKLYEAYTLKSSKKTDLIQLDSIGQLEHNDISELKSHPEAYYLHHKKTLSKKDSLAIINNFKHGMGKNVIVFIDSLGNAIGFLPGGIKLEYDSNTKIRSQVINPENKTNYRSNVKFHELNEKQIKQLALLNYREKHKTVNPENQYLYFLWTNFYYQINGVNQPSTECLKERWLFDFLMIDAANLNIPIGYKFYNKSPRHLKNIFNRMPYESDWKFDKMNKSFLAIPQIDIEYTNKWKYLFLDLATQFSLEDRIFQELVLITNYLKHKYGKEVIKDMVSWYLKKESNLMLVSSFIKEKYNIRTNINEMNADYVQWREEKYMEK